MKKEIPIERESLSGHVILDGDMKQTNEKISKRLKENILSGRWPAETRSEIEMLREYKESLKGKKIKKKL